MEKRIVFSVDSVLSKKLSQVPENERSTVIRMALRDFFRITDSKHGKVGYTEDDISTAIEGREE